MTYPYQPGAQDPYQPSSQDPTAPSHHPPHADEPTVHQQPHDPLPPTLQQPAYQPPAYPQPGEHQPPQAFPQSPASQQPPYPPQSPYQQQSPYPQQSPYQQPPGSYPPPAPFSFGYPATPPTEGLAIASLVVSCVAVLGLCFYGIGGVLGVVGAVLGHIGHGRTKTRGTQGAGMAVAGIIVGWIATVLGLIAIAFFAFIINHAYFSTS